MNTIKVRSTQKRYLAMMNNTATYSETWDEKKPLYSDNDVSSFRWCIITRSHNCSHPQPISKL